MSIPRLRDRLLAFLLAAPVVALAAATTDAAERERISRERAIVERESRVAQAACASEFAVTACIDRVKAERRQRLQDLDRQRAVLDDELRKRRAAERIEQIRQRQATLADEKPKVTVRTRSTAASEAAASEAAATLPVPTRSPEAALASRQAAASQADADASLRARAAERRASEAESHRRAVEKRNHERARVRPPAKPLPVPASSATP